MITILKIIILIIFVVIIILSCFFFRFAGCKDSKSLNYSPLSIIHDPKSCIYKQVGCMDPKIDNYNKFATTSCKDDCIHCDNKCGNKCRYTSDECTNNEKCLPIIKGCMKNWAINKSNKANRNSNCITPAVILDKITAISSKSKALLVLDGYIILDGNIKSITNGLNVIVFKRGEQLKIKEKKSYNINIKSEMDYMEYFIRNKVADDDIVVIISQGYLFKNVKQNNCKLDALKLLGSKIDKLTNDSNYFLIGSKKKDIKCFDLFRGGLSSYFSFAELDMIWKKKNFYR